MQYNGKSFNVLLDETLVPKQNSYEDFFGSNTVLDMGNDYGNKKLTPESTNKLEIKSIEKIQNVSKKKEFKWKTEWKMPSETSYVFSNQKVGVKKHNKSELLIPIEYDAIYSCDFFGHHYHGYILKKGSKFGIFVSGLKVKGEGYFIPNIFKNIPLVDQFDYVRKGFHVIALYNEEGQFLHYANQDGVEYLR